MSAPAASWCDPAGESPAQVRGSARLVVSIVWPLATAQGVPLVAVTIACGSGFPQCPATTGDPSSFRRIGGPRQGGQHSRTGLERSPRSQRAGASTALGISQLILADAGG
jgi:hypothetical protein